VKNGTGVEKLQKKVISITNQKRDRRNAAKIDAPGAGKDCFYKGIQRLVYLGRRSLAYRVIGSWMPQAFASHIQLLEFSFKQAQSFEGPYTVTLKSNTIRQRTFIAS
jgi:hypothetical protein